MRYLILIAQTIILIFVSSCTKQRLPTVITAPITDTTWIYAVCGGEVVDEGSSPVTARGVCISTENPPVVAKGSNSNYTVDSFGLGTFTSKIYFRGSNIFLPATTRYIRAYATNNQGTAFGEVMICFPRYAPPVFSTMSLAGITSTTASFNIVLEVGQYSRPLTTELDLCYSINPEPTIEGEHVSISNLNQCVISNLLPDTRYYVRAYAKNSGGTAYSSEISFTTWEGEITDKSGNAYQIKTIGDHTWTIRNLETTKFDDGSDIPLIADDLLWGSTVTSAYCKYTGYGKLYNYYAVTDSRNLCPAGWHVSTDNDWKSLEISLGMSQDQADATGQRGTVEGGMLKSTTVYDVWNSPNTGATNSSGFSAYGAGYRSNGGIFADKLISADFWCTPEYEATTAWSRSLNVSSAQIVRLNINKGYGFSVRCVKDNK